MQPRVSSCQALLAAVNGLGELSDSNVVEMRAGSHLIHPFVARASGAASRWWISLTAIEPSPTAEATRLIEPEWTSPTAKIRGRLVSFVVAALAVWRG